MFSEFIHVPKCAAINRAGSPNGDYLEPTCTHSLTVTHKGKAAVHGRANSDILQELSSPDRRHAAHPTATASALSRKTATGRRLRSFWVSMQDRTQGSPIKNEEDAQVSDSGALIATAQASRDTQPCLTAQITGLQSRSRWPHVVKEHLRCDCCA